MGLSWGLHDLETIAQRFTNELTICNGIFLFENMVCLSLPSKSMTDSNGHHISYSKHVV